MKKIFGYLIAALAGYAGGVATGYIVRKKTTEVAFEEISEEEQARQIAADEEKEPVDIVTEIDRVFGSQPDAEAKQDTQKEQYFKKWKADEALGKYDTRTAEEPENAVVTDENLEEGFDEEFLQDVTEERKTENRPDVEAASIEDWEHWERMQDDGPNDPEYDCIDILWFRDGVLTREDGDPINNPGKFIGFDVAKWFDRVDEETTGNPDVRVIYNHRKDAIFRITRKNCAYERKGSMEEFGGEYGGEDEYDE